jgi:hypothetical protein
VEWAAYLDVAWKIGLLLAGLASMLWAWLKWSARHDLVTRVEFETWKMRHAEDHDAVDTALAEGAVRFARIETQLQHLPTREDIAQLAAALGATSSDVKALMRSMSGLQDQVTMLVQREMNGS